MLFAADFITQPHDLQHNCLICFDSNFPSLNSLSCVKGKEPDGVQALRFGVCSGRRCGVCVHVCARVPAHSPPFKQLWKLDQKMFTLIILRGPGGQDDEGPGVYSGCGRLPRAEEAGH